MHISYSGLRRYHSCKRKVYYRKNAYPRAKTASMVTGSLTHKAIEFYEESGHMPDVLDLYRGKLADALGSGDIKFYKWQTVGSFMNLLEECFQNYIAISRKLPPVTHSEQEFEIEYDDGVTVRGIFDQVRESNTVLEFKTSKHEPDEDYLRADLQSDVYTWAYRQVHSVFPFYYYVHLPSGKVYEVEKRDFADLHSQIKDYIYDYTHEIFTRQREKRKCDWCDWRRHCLKDTEASSFVLQATHNDEPEPDRRRVNFSAF